MAAVLTALPPSITIQQLSIALGTDDKLTTYLMESRPSKVSSLDACIGHCASRFLDLHISGDSSVLNTHQRLVSAIWNTEYLQEDDLTFKNCKRIFEEDPSIINIRTSLVFYKCLYLSIEDTTPARSLVGATLLMLAFLRRKYRFAQFLLKQSNCDVNAVTSSGLRAIECLALERVLGHNRLIVRGHGEEHPWENNHSPEALDCLRLLLEKNVDLLPVESNPKPSVFHLFALHDQAIHLELVLNKQIHKVRTLKDQVKSIIAEKAKCLPTDICSLISTHLYDDNPSALLEMRSVGHFTDFEQLPTLNSCIDPFSPKLCTSMEGYTPLLLALSSAAVSTAKLLVERGANLSAKTNYPESVKSKFPGAKDWSVQDFMEGKFHSMRFLAVLRRTAIDSVCYTVSEPSLKRTNLENFLKEQTKSKQIS